MSDTYNMWGKNLKTDEKIDKFSELKWVRIFDPVHIPKEYVEQIKNRNFSVEKFYKMQKMTCIEEVDGKILLNPLNLLFVIVNANNIVKGFCWMVVDPLSNSLVINSFSMDKEFWGDGKAVHMLEKKAIELQEGAQLDRIYWVTRYPKHSEKYGFKKSKNTIMEYIGHGRDNNGQSSEAERESGPDDSRTEAVS